MRAGIDLNYCGNHAFSARIRKFHVLGLSIGLTASVVITVIREKGGFGTFNHYTIFVIIVTIWYGIGGNLILQKYK